MKSIVRLNFVEFIGLAMGSVIVDRATLIWAGEIHRPWWFAVLPLVWLPVAFIYMTLSKRWHAVSIFFFLFLLVFSSCVTFQPTPTEEHDLRWCRGVCGKLERSSAECEVDCQLGRQQARLHPI